MSDGSRRVGCLVMGTEPAPALRARWREVEDAGFHSLWAADHLMSYPKLGVFLEAWTTLGAMAEATSRIRIGTLVTNITYRNPVVLAREAITIDHLSGGRLELGIGAAGSRAQDAQVAGVEEWTAADRVARFAEFVALVDGLLTGRIDDFAGAHYRTEGFDRGPWPVQSPRPPLTIAAHGRRALAVAAAHADTWNAVAGFGRSGPELFAFLRESNDRLDELAARAGRDPTSIRRSVLVQHTGTDWWSSPAALDDLVGTLDEAGMRDLVFYYPPIGDASPALDDAGFLDLVAPLLEAQ